MDRTIGILTIGQSPREDVTPELQEYLGGKTKIIEAGALDGLSLEQIRALAPQEGDSVLVSRLTDGSWIKLAEEKLIPLIQKKINVLNNQKLNLILLLCTADFPPFNSCSLLVEPYRIIRSIIPSILPFGKKLGLIVPEKEQVEQLVQVWSAVIGRENSVVASAGSPYESLEAVMEAAKKLKPEQPELIVLDCIGYNKEMKRIVEEILEKPVVLARGLIGRLTAELLGV